MIPSNHHATERFDLMHSPTLRTGLLTGVLLSLVMAISLFGANRTPWLERLATERNAVCSVAFLFVILIPICRFWRSPVLLFTSGIVGWALFTAAYVGAGNFFENLYSRIRTPGIILAYGAAAYGMAAVIAWVAPMVRSAILVSPIPVRRRPRHAVHHHR